jgi:predicted dehydrogenase
MSLRFGILACSSVARRRFLPALSGAAAARLERVGSRDRAKAEQYAREFSCKKFGTYEEVLADPEVDIVYISTPPPLHAEWVQRAAASGKHVWCEKPAFGDLPSATEAVKRCRQAAVRLIEGYVFKYHPQHARVRALIAEGRIGEPRLFHAEFTYPRPPAGDIRLQPGLQGGVFHDSAGYPLAAALLQMPGEPVSIFCQAGTDRATGLDDALCFWLRFSSGAMAQMFVAFGAHYRSRYSVLGTRGRIELERAFAVPPQTKTSLLLETETGEERITLELADQFRLMIEDVAAQVQAPAGSEPKNFEGDLLRLQTVMDAAARSLREGRAIDLPPK